MENKTKQNIGFQVLKNIVCPNHTRGVILYVNEINQG